MSCMAAGHSKARRMRAKASARPCTPMPMGRWRKFEFFACCETERRRRVRGAGGGSGKEKGKGRGQKSDSLFERTHLNDWVEVDIDDFVQIARNDFGDFVQSLEVVRAVGLIHEGGEVEGRQIAHSDLLKEGRERGRKC